MAITVLVVWQHTRWVCWFALVELYKSIVKICPRKMTSFVANNLCYDYGGDGGQNKYALRNIVSIERVCNLRCDFIQASPCMILTTIWWLANVWRGSSGMEVKMRNRARSVERKVCPKWTINSGYCLITESPTLVKSVSTMGSKWVYFVGSLRRYSRTSCVNNSWVSSFA